MRECHSNITKPHILGRASESACEIVDDGSSYDIHMYSICGVCSAFDSLSSYHFICIHFHFKNLWIRVPNYDTHFGLNVVVGASKALATVEEMNSISMELFKMSLCVRYNWFRWLGCCSVSSTAVERWRRRRWQWRLLPVYKYVLPIYILIRRRNFAYVCIYKVSANVHRIYGVRAAGQLCGLCYFACMWRHKSMNVLKQKN